MARLTSFLKERAIPIVVFCYGIFLIYWIWIYTTGETNSFHNYFWGFFPQGIFPIAAGVYGFFLARKWGFMSSALGRAIVFLSASNLLLGIGSVIWVYYNLVQGVEIPYPSLSDVFWVPNILFFIFGLIELGRGVGAGYKLRTPRGKAALILAPIISLSLTYIIFILIAQGGSLGFEDSTPLQIFINMFYLLGDVIILVVIGLIYSLSYKVLGGRFKWAANILLISALVGYIGDAVFTFREAQEIYYNADIGDLLFTMGPFLSIVAVVSLDIKGISSRVRSELAMFAPRATEAINNLVLEIIQRQVHIIGPVAWDEATKVQGITIDAQKNSLSVDGDPKIVLEQLVGRYEGLFGGASLEICREATRKFIAQVPPEQIPDVLK